MKAQPLPSQEILIRVLRYVPETGKLYWKERDSDIHASHDVVRWNSRWAGKEAFTCLSNKGYLTGSVFGRAVKAHRVIFKMIHNEEPEQVDHINGRRCDNRITNLRAANAIANMRNMRLRKASTSGVCGVSFNKALNRWVAYISDGGKRIHLGCYMTLEMAISVRKHAEVKAGYHANHGRAA